MTYPETGDNRPGWLTTEASYRALFEQSSNAIFLEDENDRILDVNPRACELLGYTRAELLSLKVSDLVAPEARPAEGIVRYDLRHLLGAPFESLDLHRSGQRIPVEITITPIDLGPGPRVILTTVRDIRERRLAEELRTAIYQISQAAINAAHLDDLYHTIYQILNHLMPAQNLFIALYDAAGELLSFPFFVDEYDTPSPPHKPGRGLTEYVLRTGEPLLASPERFEELIQEGEVELIGIPSIDWLGVPLKTQGPPFGVLAVQSYTPSIRFDETHKEILAFVSAQIALAIERKRAEIAEHEQRTRAETLAEVAMALVSHTELAALLDEILRQARRLVPCDAGNIALLDGNTLRVASSQGYEKYTVNSEPLPMFQKLNQLKVSETAVREVRSVIIPDTRQESSWVTFAKTSWIASFLVVPICLHGQILGLLRLEGARPNRFSESDAARLQPLADAAAIALERTQLLADAQRRAAELEAIREASLSLTSSLDLETVFYAILGRTFDLLSDISNTHIFTCRDGNLSFGAALWPGGRRGEPVAMPRRAGLTYTVAQSGEMIVVPDMRAHPLYATAPPEWQGAIVGLPLKIGERVVGVMNISSTRPRSWAPAELRVLRLLADQAAVAIENAQLHDEIRRHVAELEARVAKRTAELAAANATLHAAAQKLQELDRMKSEFVSNVSHELRTPLANIKVYLYLLEKGKPEKRAEYMATLARESDLLQSLIEDLLHLSRLDLGKVEPALRAVDINTLVTTLTRDRALMLSAQGLTLALTITPDLPPVQSDAKMLTQVLTNLLTNAMHYTPAGGTVTVETGLSSEGVEREASSVGRPAEITRSTPHALRPTEGQWVTLSVSDTGPGILPEEQPRIFERFYRGEAARRTGAPGTGLGLAICREIIARLGGQITVTSQPGQGSTFAVWLPIAEERLYLTR